MVEAAAWLMVTLTPATTSVPERGLAAALAATTKRRRPDPVPPAEPWIAIQATAGCAVHAHVSADAVTATSLAPPWPANDVVAGAMVNVQGAVGGGPAAACVTVTTMPATITVPARALPVVFGATT